MSQPDFALFCTRVTGYPWFKAMLARAQNSKDWPELKARYDQLLADAKLVQGGENILAQKDVLGWMLYPKPAQPKPPREPKTQKRIVDPETMKRFQNFQRPN